MRLLVIGVFLFASQLLYGKGDVTLSPKDYGLLSAKNGEERYIALKKCHEDAVKKNVGVSYAGIDTIEITIPNRANSIPLPIYTDFSGVTLIVTNHYKYFWLYSFRSKTAKIEVAKREIDKGYFKKKEALKKGEKLLIIKDENPWILVRLGYKNSTPKFRKDVMLIKNGKAQNKTICPYNNDYSNPSVTYADVSGEEIVIKNLNFIRSKESSEKTNLLEIRNTAHIRINNITITTPQNDLNYSDAAFVIEDCADLTMDDITINGTYSDYGKDGYGIRLLNVYDTKINRLTAKCKWGVFGNYNVNKAILQYCDINRFDVHSYGRDFMFNRCKFSDCYNQFASVYGNITFNECVFENQIPFLQESTFNAFTPFELVFKDCVFHLDKTHNYIITLYGVPEVINERHELEKKCLPNIVINNCDVYIPDEVTKWYLIQTRGVKYKGNFDYIKRIILNEVKLYGNDKAEFDISDEPLSTEKRIRKRNNFKKK